MSLPQFNLWENKKNKNKKKEKKSMHNPAANPFNVLNFQLF